uniref:Mediator of RNA polymerase II transcription subunit 28 n=1 Tax=Nicotiana tabacum TaxID=4097 RepID=A0A1S3ZJG7_TOBAC|nr:PREDICTED: mediator of RNA polymerase II transcription subunit 28-like [Nicotiana tabacum]XP_033517079.1 mediator of RNA polymerase II transcription subunit 28-like [Nicotiana tomentosiformis]
MNIATYRSCLVDVERHARDFIEAAKKLQLYLIGLQREDLPSKVDMLRKEIVKMEEKLKRKTELITKQERLIQNWKRNTTLSWKGCKLTADL